MYVKNHMLGRKIQVRTEIAQEERKKQKQLRQWRKDNLKKANRKKKEKTLLKRIKQLEVYKKMNERPYINYEAGLELYNDINLALTALNLTKNHYSGALRRKLDRIMTIQIVIETYYPPNLYIFAKDFTAQMAELGYICNFMSHREMPKGMGYTNYSFSVDGIYILIHFCLPEQLGAYLLYTTGNENFWRKITSHARHERSLLKKDGLYSAGELLVSDVEQNIFKTLGLRDIPPTERSFGVTDSLKTFQINY